jgi:molybdate transport system regulatory protein
MGDKRLGDTRLGDTRLTLRLDFGANRSIGPGKVLLLEAIGRTGSISQAGRELGMSYRRAWLLVNDLNLCFRHAVVAARPGGSQGGGAQLTKFGQKLVADYRAIESDAFSATKSHLRKLESSLRPADRQAAEKPKKTSIRSRTR